MFTKLWVYTYVYKLVHQSVALAQSEMMSEDQDERLDQYCEAFVQTNGLENFCQTQAKAPRHAAHDPGD